MSDSASSDVPTVTLLDALLQGEVARFDTELQKTLRGSVGMVIRRAHLTEQFAERLFRGNYQEALKAMDKKIAELGQMTPREAAETHEGMLRVKALIDRRERASRKPRGLAALFEALDHAKRRELEPLLDLFPAAWGLSDFEFEQLLHAPPGWLNAWRNHEVGADDAMLDRLRYLRQFHDALRLVTMPQRYASMWRRQWRKESPIGQRSPWEAYQELGDEALAIIERDFRSQ